MIGTELPQASIHVVEGHSLVIPLIVDGLPESITVLGRHWQRKREFHLTALAERALATAGVRGAAWDPVVRVTSGRRLGPVRLQPDLRVVAHPDDPALHTVIAMATCSGLEELIGDLADTVGSELPVPPAHVTLYSTDPARGIGISDHTELAQRAPTLDPSALDEVRRAIGI